MNNDTSSSSNDTAGLILWIVIGIIVGVILLSFVAYRIKECYQKWKKRKEDNQFNEALIKKEEQDKINILKKKYREKINSIKSKNTVILEPDGRCIEYVKNNDEKV